MVNSKSFQFKKRPFYRWQNIGLRRALQTTYPPNAEVDVYLAYLSYFSQIRWPLAKPMATLLAKCTPKELLDVAKAITMECKMNQHYTSWWKYFVDLEVLVGYPKLADRIGSSDEISEWLSGRVEMQVEAREIRDTYNEIFGPRVAYDMDTFDVWWRKRYTWFNSGASSESTLFVDGQKRRTKTGTALSWTDDQIIHLMDWKTIQDKGLRIFVKPDEKGPKLRHIISAPVGLYIRMLYVLKKIEKAYPHLRDRFAQYMDRRELLERVRQGIDEVQIPIDASAFDYNVADTWWHVFYDKLADDGIEVDQVIGFKKLVGTMKWNYEDRTGIWTKGVPSGLVFTAFIDSLVNLAAMKIVARRIPELKVLLAQGDDGYMQSEHMIDLPKVAKLYKLLVGMVVNEKKNWQAYGVGEFLKMIIKKSSIDQYPARVWSSLFWAYPDFRDNDKMQKMFELAALWKEFYDRCKLCFDDQVYSDLHAVMPHNISKDVVKKWLHAPSTLGGFGLAPLKPYVIKVKRSSRDRDFKGLLYPRYFERENTFDRKSVVRAYPIEIDTSRGSASWLSLSKLSPQFDTLEEFIEVERWKAGLDSTYIPTGGVTPDSLDPFTFPKFAGVSDLAVQTMLSEYVSKVPLVKSRARKAAIQMNIAAYLSLTQFPYFPFLLK